MSRVKIIEFNSEPHEYRIKGIWVPSITQCLSAAGFDYWKDVNPRLLERNRKFGKNFHRARELYDNGTLDFKTLDKAFWPYLDQWARVKKDYGIRVLKSEEIVYSQKYMSAGTMDIKVIYKGDLAVIDTKLVFEVYPSTNLQLAGYQAFYNEMHPNKKIKKRLIINLTGEGRPEVRECTNQMDWIYMLSAIHIAHCKIHYKIFKKEKQTK